MGYVAKQQACLIYDTIPVYAWMKLLILRIYSVRTVDLQREISKAGRSEKETLLVIRF